MSVVMGFVFLLARNLYEHDHDHIGGQVGKGVYTVGNHGRTVSDKPGDHLSDGQHQVNH